MTINANGYKINNVPAYAMEYAYIVARECDDAMWFWGAWNDQDKALAVAVEIGGVLIPMVQ